MDKIDDAFAHENSKYPDAKMMFTRSMTSASNSSRGSSRSSVASSTRASAAGYVVADEHECDYDYDDPTDEDWVPRTPVTVDGPLRRSARLNSSATGSVTRHHESNTTQQHSYNTRSNKRC